MREIKFRGKTKAGEWVYGDYLRMYYEKDFSGSGLYIVVHYIQRIIGNDNIREEILPETICQYTGLLDKNGNEIYHKDKIKMLGFNTQYEVVLIHGAFGYITGKGLDRETFTSFAQAFFSLSGKDNQLNAVELVSK